MEIAISNGAAAAQAAEIAVENQTSVAVMPTESGAKPVSWQQFGKDFRGEDVSIADAVQRAGLNFNVLDEEICRVPKEVADAIRNGQPMIGWHPTVDSLISSHKATYRDDTGQTLGVVGKSYGIVQNDVAFGFVDYLAKVSGRTPKIETAGSLGVGGRVFVTATLGDDLDLGGGDMVKNYAVISNNHDGKGSVMVFFSPIRVICQNTLNMAIRTAANKVTFTHTSRVNDRIAREQEDIAIAKRVFGDNFKFSEAFMQEMEQLKAIKVNAAQVRDFVAGRFLTPAQFKLWQQADYKLDAVEEISSQKKNQIANFATILNTGIGQQQHRGTGLWLVNGVTTLLHNYKSWKDDGQSEFNSLLSGSGLNTLQDAYRDVLALKAA